MLGLENHGGPERRRCGRKDGRQGTAVDSEDLRSMKSVAEFDSSLLLLEFAQLLRRFVALFVQVALYQVASFCTW